MIEFDGVSKFYGDILGVNRVSLRIGPGITSLVGPNGAGKSTLMNLMTGLLQPTRGRISVLGATAADPEALFQKVGYCPLFDSFPRGFTGWEFVESYLALHGYARAKLNELVETAIERVGLSDAAGRKVDGYSKGMRQRIRLALAIAHQPEVLVLDEPLNGLDPLARAEVIRLFRKLADDGMYLILSSHILHEVDILSDRVVVLNNGYVIADGDVSGVRQEMKQHPAQIVIRCDHAAKLAARLFGEPHVVEVKLHEDRGGLLVKSSDPDGFYLAMNRIVLEGGIRFDSIAPADDDLNAVYQYLIG